MGERIVTFFLSFVVPCVTKSKSIVIWCDTLIKQESTHTHTKKKYTGVLSTFTHAMLTSTKDDDDEWKGTTYLILYDWIDKEQQWNFFFLWECLEKIFSLSIFGMDKKKLTKFQVYSCNDTGLWCSLKK